MATIKISNCGECPVRYDKVCNHPCEKSLMPLKDLATLNKGCRLKKQCFRLGYNNYIA